MSEGSPRPRNSPPLRKKRRKLLVMGLLGVVAWLVFRDEALKPVDDLMPRRPAIAWDDNNGWKRLEDFALGLFSMDSKEEKQVRELIRKEQEPLPEWANTFILDDSQVAALEVIAATPLFQGHRYEKFSESPSPGETALISLLTRFQVTILFAMEDNKVPQVLRLWKLFATLQRKMTAGATSGYMLSYAKTLTDTAMVLLSLVRLDWKDAELKELAGALAGESVTVEDTREAAYHDFRRGHTFLINMRFTPDGYGGEETSLIRKLFYQKHRTANHYAEQIRVWRDGIFVSTPEEIEKKQEECASSFPPWLDPNLHGTSILTGGPFHYGSGTPWHGGRAERQMIQVLIALHRCLKARGSLPARLDELVPEFLSAVPEDPYRGGPLSWDPGHRAVQNTGGEGIIRPVDPKQTKLISDDYRTFLFRTKAEEDARRASAPPAPAGRGDGKKARR